LIAQLKGAGKNDQSRQHKVIMDLLSGESC